MSLLLVSVAVKAQQSNPVPVVKEEALTAEERAYGLSQIWSEAKYNFVYFDKLKIDWDSLYKVTLPKVTKAQSTQSYYDELRYFATQLNDGHTGVWYPLSYYQTVAASPAINTALIEGKVFITEVLNDTLTNQGVLKGMEILKINDVNAIEYGNTRVAPFESASTPQGKEMIVFAVYLLNGPLDEPLKLTVKDAKGKITEQVINRRLKKREVPAMAFAVNKDGIGILTINSFDSKDFNKKFDALYPELLKTKGLIIDLRENGGGDANQGYYMLKHFTKTPFSGSLVSFRQYNVAMKVWGLKVDTYFQFVDGTLTPFSDRTTYEKPIAVLIAKHTYSAAEDFTLLFDHIRRGALVGQPSGGSTGKAFYTKLPGGGTFRMCVKKDAYPDGKIFVGVGIQPTILVPENATAFVKGKDQTFDQALDYLKVQTSVKK